MRPLFERTSVGREDYSPYGTAWDLAFHTIPVATIDPDFAKHQLDRLTRE